ncbi:MAG: 30S ribosomal protein S16, partial [Fidelibacterota bacterium]
MATHIRLKRMGRRNRPFFRVVVMDSRAKRDGAAIEELGWYDPVKTETSFSLKEDRIIYWLQEGAQPSDTVKNLMEKSGLAYRWHLMGQGLDDKAIDHELQKWILDRRETEERMAQRRAKEAEEKEKAKAQAAVEEGTVEPEAVKTAVDEELAEEEVSVPPETEQEQEVEETASDTTGETGPKEPDHREDEAETTEVSEEGTGVKEE